MASDFAAYVARRSEEGTRVEEFTPSATAGETGLVGELMYYDTSSGTIKRCGADPALIAGISEVGTVVNATITPNGKVPLRLLSSAAVVAMPCATTYVEATHRGVLYGIVRLSSGHWAVDVGDTSNTRVIVVDADAASNTWFVQFIAANLQFDAVAS